MSTHAIVGTKTATGFRGRYVHFDGYPDAMIPALISILQRDGYDTAVKTITEDHAEWTTLIGETGRHTEPYRGEVTVPGYGNADTVRGMWYTEADRNGPAHWAYTLTPTGVEVWEWLHENHASLPPQVIPSPRATWVRRPDLDRRWPLI